VVLETGHLGFHAHLAAGLHRAARIDAVAEAAAEGLALEAIRHRHYGVGLESLLLEFEFHGSYRLLTGT
jgi:hypothetical protein